MAQPPGDDPSNNDASESPDERDGSAGDTTPRTVHDALFKAVFGDPRHAAAVLQAILPPRVARHIDWDSLEPAQASVVDRLLHQRHGDLLFSARLKEGQPAFVWVHYEHQSSVDPVMSWRMVEVAIELLKRWRAHHPEARRFPPILPVVFYHGSTQWNAPTSFLDLYEMSDQARADLADYLLSMRYVLDDLRTTDDEDIDARPLEPLPRLGLLVMKYATAEELGEHLAAHHEDIRMLLATEHGRAGWFMILRYTWYTNPHMDRDTLTRHLVPAVGPEIEETMLTYGQKLEQQGFARGRAEGLEQGLEQGREQGLEQGREQGLEQGREQGLEQGREQGLAQGQRALLLRLLERRFGPLPQPITERVTQAGMEDVATWGERILDAASLDDVFAS